MTTSQPDTSDIAPDNSHLNQMGRELVATLCMDALRIAGSSVHVRTEVEGFKQSRSAHDATRLANALWFFEQGHPEVVALVERIDEEAEQTAGFPLPNRIRRVK